MNRINSNTISLDEASEILNCEPVRLRALLKAGKLPFEYIEAGDEIHIIRKSFETILKKEKGAELYVRNFLI